MSTVYQHQLHAHKTRRPHPWRWIMLVIAVLVGFGWYGFKQMKPQTVVSKPATVIKKIETKDAVDTYQKSVFKIDLPKGWQFMGKQQDIYTIYHFKSTQAGDAGNRQLDIYEDSSLPNFALNRMLPVTATEQGTLVTDVSQISDNCDEYTNGAPAGASSSVPAKWQGITFLCDKANTLRNVVGIGSKDGLNMVNLKTQTSRQHRYFISYTDNNFTPDYSVFAKAINSFTIIE